LHGAAAAERSHILRGVRVAYLVTRYPAASRAFIQREVLALRGLGVEVDTFSLRRADDADVLTGEDRAEREATYSLQPIRAGQLLRDHALALGLRPLAYVATLAHAVGRGRGVRGRLGQLAYFGDAIQLWAELRRRGIDHLHVHFVNAGADVALLAARFSGDALTWSLTLHGPAEFYDVTENRLESKLSEAAWIACVSDWVRSQAMVLLPPEEWEKLRVVRLGLDTTKWTPLPKRADDDELRVLNVGRLDPVKGQALLVEAIGQLRSEGLDVLCTIAGAGPEQDELEALIADAGLSTHVTLAGSVGQDRIRELYAWADVFCLPSFRESLPVVLMEALAMEVPVVATRIAGIPELVDDQANGLLVAPGRVDELAAALARLARDPDLRRELGHAGRRRVERDYELAQLAGYLRSAFAAPASEALDGNR
jgi:colanic acid/amylovoran biosynthesis glycosyltransferase